MARIVKGLKGDIFSEWRNGYDVMAVFSHNGFTGLNGRLRLDRPLAPYAPELPNLGDDDPWQGTPQPLGGGTWFIAFHDHSNRDYGLNDEDTKAAFSQIYSLCEQHHLTRVLTNGVRSPIRPSSEEAEDARVRFLYRLALSHGKVSTTFIDLRDTFSRNPP